MIEQDDSSLLLAAIFSLKLTLMLVASRAAGPHGCRLVEVPEEQKSLGTTSEHLKEKIGVPRNPKRRLYNDLWFWIPRLLTEGLLVRI